MPIVRQGLGSALPSSGGGKGGGKFIPHVRLSDDGDKVRFRVVTSLGQWGVEPEQIDMEAPNAGLTDTIVVGEFHRKMELSKNGKPFARFVPCDFDIEAGNVTGSCDLCTQEIGRSTQFMMWVYVYSYFHRAPNPDTATNPWPLVQFGNLKLYKQEVNDFAIWQDGFYMKQKVEGKAAQYGTLADRDYIVTRHGVRGTNQVTRDLEAIKAAPIPMDVIAKAKDLPLLEKVALGEVETFGAAAQANNLVPEVSLDTPVSMELGVDELDDTLDLDFDSLGASEASFDQGTTMESTGVVEGIEALDDIPF